MKTDIRMGLMKEFHAAGIKTHVYHYQKTEPVQETQTTPLFGDQELADSG
ncbi:MAG: hypothetical protein GWN14_15340 [candidate division Zixibacteria bacterium]|nr:hypothetical protein [Gammaproteobacteria bacterium]NIX57256.1 hypothetical protein [candidate division Zixibacteria bacterium]